MLPAQNALLATGRHRAFGLGLLLCLAGLLLTGPALADRPAPGLRSVVLQLHWHHQFQFAGYYVARELGYYRDAGLDVEIRDGGSGISPLAEVIDGRADFGIDGSGLLVEYARGQPVVAVAALFQKSPLRLIARADRGIHSLHDLVGKRVMLLPGYRSLALVAMLDQTGLLNRIVRINSSSQIDDLLEDRVEAFNGYNSNEPYAMRAAGVRATLFDPTAYGIQFYSDVLFTEQRTARDDPQLVQAFRDASIRGWIKALEDPGAAIALIRANYAQDRTVDHLAFEARGVRESIMPDVVEIGHMSELRWLKIRDQLAGLGVVPKGTSIDAFLFRQPTEGVSWQQLQPYILAAVICLGIVLAAIAFVIRKNIQLQDEVTVRQAAERRANHLATHDHLTGLPNRMLLMDRLDKSLARARRHGHTPMLALIDLDHFKQLNDLHGHQRGDQVLAEIARRVSDITREEDTFARMGGDEFVLVFDNIPASIAGHEAGRLLQTIRAAAADIAADVDIGASIGVLTISNPVNLSSEQALRLADDLMYHVKHGSRNSFLVHDYDGHGESDDNASRAKTAERSHEIA